jgi:hypothetical protein
VKLFYCPLCKDLVALRLDDLRFCACRKSYGQYKDDGIHAVMGGWAIPFALSSDTLSYYVYIPWTRSVFDEWVNLQVDKSPQKYSVPVFWRKDYGDGSIDRIEL